MTHADTPVLVGVGQRTVKGEPLTSLSRPLDLMQAAAHDAAKDAGLTPATLEQLDTLAVVKSFREPTPNSPASLCRRLGCHGARPWLVPDGGNAPQYLVNHFFEAIARGEAKFVLLTGAEAMDNARRLIKSGTKPHWSETPLEPPGQWLYPPKPMWTAHEQAHGIWLAAHVYPLFECALRAHEGQSLTTHQRQMGELFAAFSSVAAEHPHAWFPTAHDAETIAAPSPSNRFVGWPYTKLMNAMNQINQSAALLLTSVGNARTLGIPADRWVFLHGCADTSERWFVSDRLDYHSSPAMAAMGRAACGMAGVTIDEIEYLDLYSCFPSAVSIGRNALGMKPSDSRPLTVTGGLPYHGGAGNNYSMNAIATMAERLREHPGQLGLVTANGGYLSKHSAGIYAARPPAGRSRWRRPDPGSYQPDLEQPPSPTLVEAPEGRARIETYTVTFGRDGKPQTGIVIGRLGESDDPMAPRFLANTPRDETLLLSMTQAEFVGHRGRVKAGGDINLFDPD